MAIEAQALADFIVEFTSPEHEDNQEEIWTIHMDESSTQKKGRAGIVITSPEGDVLTYGVQLKFPVTNNEVEYEAILTRLRIAYALRAKNALLRSDSQLVIRFGIPQMIISDNGRQFDNQGFRLFCSSLGIKNKYSSLGHPQANGQTGVTNWTFLKIINARLVGVKGACPEELPSVLWAYRTTTRTFIGETPFNLSYGMEAVILIEIGLTSPRMEFFDEHSNNDQLMLNLDCLDEVRDQAS
nr:uncharacterized protein LOC112025030 [Quercus suber]